MGNFAQDMIANLMGGGSQPAAPAKPQVDIKGLTQQAQGLKTLLDQINLTPGRGGAVALKYKQQLDDMNNQLRAAGGKAVE